MKLKYLCDAAGIYCPDVYFDWEIEDISTDSRKEMKNAMFVCLCGTQFDSHNYIGEAIGNGAICILTDRNHPDIVAKEGIAFLQIPAAAGWCIARRCRARGDSPR